MIPGNRLSSIAQAAVFIGNRNKPKQTALEDSESFNQQVSELVYQLEAWEGVCDGSVITLSAVGEDDIIAATDTDITEFSFTFDQNKHPVISYVAGGIAKLKWYDPTVPGTVTTAYDNTYVTPRVSLDDKHRLAADTSDVIFAYIRANRLRVRIQRERYETEHDYGVVPTGTKLRRIGMNFGNRFTFEAYTEDI